MLRQGRVGCAGQIAHYAVRRGESRAGPKSVAQIANYAKKRVGKKGMPEQVWP